MVNQRRGLVHKRGSAGDFLFSKTDTKSFKTKRTKARESAWKALKQFFPDLLSGKRFLEHSVNRLESTDKFGAMVIKMDNLTSKKEESNTHKKIIQALDTVCQKENGLWGILEPGMLGCFFPEKDEFDCYRLARSFQKSLKNQSKKTVTIGIASFPTLKYEKHQILDNAHKALMHAAFFGPSSAQIFDAVSLNISGDQLYETGDIKEAIEEYNRALLLDPSNTNVHNSLGICYGVLKDYKKAKKAFIAAVELDPDEYMAVYNLGLTNLLSGQPGKALKLFLKANSIVADVFEIAFQTGKLYLERGEPENARKLLEQASRLKPTAGAVFRYMGECYATLNQVDAAIAAYKRAIKQNPGDAASLSALGCLFDEQGENPEIAIMFCRESVGLSPENGLFRHRLGQLYLKQNHLEDALKEFKKANTLGHDARDVIEKIENQIRTKAS